MGGAGVGVGFAVGVGGKITALDVFKKYISRLVTLEAARGGDHTTSPKTLLSPIVKLKVGDTECPLQVCQLSRSSESTHFRSFVEM